MVTVWPSLTVWSGPAWTVGGLLAGMSWPVWLAVGATVSVERTACSRSTVISTTRELPVPKPPAEVMVTL